MQLGNTKNSSRECVLQIDAIEPKNIYVSLFLTLLARLAVPQPMFARNARLFNHPLDSKYGLRY
jgi:hypothetical protein